MKRVIPFLLVIVMVTSCKTGCDAEKIVSSGLSGAVAMALQCKNPAQIQTDVMKVLDSNNVCPAAAAGKQGAIAMIVCPIVVTGAVSLLGSQIPASWECNPDMASKGLAAVLTTACNLLPF